MARFTQAGADGKRLLCVHFNVFLASRRLGLRRDLSGKKKAVARWAPWAVSIASFPRNLNTEFVGEGTG